MHIPPEHLLPQDMIDIHDHGQSPPKVLRMHVSDAKHAMSVEPERYRLPGHVPAPVAEPEPEDRTETEIE